jgi:hypothetical protein
MKSKSRIAVFGERSSACAIVVQFGYVPSLQQAQDPFHPRQRRPFHAYQRSAALSRLSLGLSGPALLIRPPFSGLICPLSFFCFSCAHHTNGG